MIGIQFNAEGEAGISAASICCILTRLVRNGTGRA